MNEVKDLGRRGVPKITSFPPSANDVTCLPCRYSMKDLGGPKRYVLPHPPSRDDLTVLPCRYSVNEVEDLGGPRKYVIPTPAEMTVTDTNHLQLNTRDWAIYAPDKFSNEARLLGGRM